MVNITSFSDMKAAQGEDGDQAVGGPGSGNFAEHVYSRRPAPTLRGNEGVGFIYHEVQESALCGQHCLNNLLQQRSFTEFALADIAHQLDAEERMILAGADSNNVDATGNFSIQVLSRALQLKYNIDLVNWAADVTVDPLQFSGMVVNRKEHWFAIRQINGTWYNLNSTAERPEKIPTEHMPHLVQQMRGDGYQIFLPTGTRLPQAGRLPPGFRGDALDGKFWCKESDLYLPLNRDQPGSSGGAVAAFSGKGNRLDGKSNDAVPPQAAHNGFGIPAQGDEDDPELAAAIAASLGEISGVAGGSDYNSQGAMRSDDTYDEDLAKALALSEQEVSGSSSAATSAVAAEGDPPKSEKELARERRLKALAARGL
eukprot:GSChrysophyteH1.ASY1.ANO1.2379.1 assembled CDS